jgi:hypothetical protein
MPRGSRLTTGITDRHRKVAHGILVEEKPIRTALLEAGYSQASAEEDTGGCDMGGYERQSD